jgi:hypothetical protein
MTDIDHIEIKPDTFGWKIVIHTTDEVSNGNSVGHTFGIGDAIQFHDEVERTIGRWLADGPADFHSGTDSTEPIYVREDTDHGR